MIQDELFEERFLRPIESLKQTCDNEKSKFNDNSCIWIPDKDNGFIKATIVKSIPDKQVVVRTHDNKVYLS